MFTFAGQSVQGLCFCLLLEYPHDNKFKIAARAPLFKLALATSLRAEDEPTYFLHGLSVNYFDQFL
jgi:hypothetical protein